MAMSEQGELLGEPDVQLAGLPEFAPGSEPMANFVLDAIYESLDTMPKQRRRDPESVEELVTRAIRGKVNEVWGKKPLCHVMVLRV
jgi:ribonuclease J